MTSLEFEWLALLLVGGILGAGVDTERTRVSKTWGTGLASGVLVEQRVSRVQSIMASSRTMGFCQSCGPGYVGEWALFRKQGRL